MAPITLALWLVSYIVSVALFLDRSRKFSLAFQRVIVLFNSRSISNPEPLSDSEKVAFERAERLNRSWRRAFGAVSALFASGVVLSNLLHFEGVLKLFLAIVPGGFFLFSVWVAMNMFSKTEQFEEVICAERFNPARASEFL